MFCLTFQNFFTSMLRINDSVVALLSLFSLLSNAKQMKSSYSCALRAYCLLKAQSFCCFFFFSIHANLKCCLVSLLFSFLLICLHSKITCSCNRIYLCLLPVSLRSISHRVCLYFLLLLSVIFCKANVFSSIKFTS